MFVVTGGGSGIGRSLTHALAARDKKVLIVGRRHDALLETASFSPLISVCCADISNSQGRQDVVTHLQNVSNLEGIIHNAAVLEPITPMATVHEEAWEKAIDTNLNAPLFLSQLLLPKLRAGRVLHIGSGAAYFPVSAWSAYCVSKAALSMLTRCWQLESKEPAFASVMPGIIDTDMQTFIRQTDCMDDDKLQFFKSLKQKDQLLAPETVALFLSWLLLDIKKEEYVAKEWDIYDSSHHSCWLVKPHVVPHWE